MSPEQGSIALQQVNTGGGVEVELDLASYCARPMCRAEFRQNVGRGRRRDYCSETCRRLADRDYKRAKAMVAHFDELAARYRHDVAAFGRAGDELEEPGQPGPGDADRETARAALARAGAVLEFAADQDDRMLAELRALHDAVAAVVLAQR